MDVPAPLVRGAALLRCPVCSGALRVLERSLVCDEGHTYDVARHGHVTLAQSPAAGDDAEMVAARVAVFEAGHYAPLTAALARAACGGDASTVAPRAAAVSPGAASPRAGTVSPGAAFPRADPVSPGAAATVLPAAPVVLDVGAGTGQHLAGVLAGVPGALGIALDTSRPALRHAARRERIAAVVADVWQGLPVRDGVVDLVLDVFAPRNAAEFARVLRPGGTLVVAVPTPEHLAELAHLHAVQVDPAKADRLERTLGAHLELETREAVRWTMDLDAAAVEHVLRMSPAGAHRREAEPRAAAVTGSVELWIYRRRSGTSASP